MATMSTEGPDQKVLLDVLSNLGLVQYYPNKLKLQSLLEVNKNSINEKSVVLADEVPFHYLRKLFKVNAGCRNYTQLFSSHEETDDFFESLDLYTEDGLSETTVHPLDLIVCLFLCADSFLQQEMALKLSLCQFSVPLLLPHTNNSQCTLMSWALREIVKEWCPHDLCESKGFVEDYIVQAKIPLFSFVRLKNCSLSKSQLLNQVLSRGQQNHNMFIHRDMEGGTLTRKLSNGLVEVCWFLPCGKENMDTFREPIALANLRGEICESSMQFTFLCEVSNAVFVFLDTVEEKENTILNALDDAKSKLHFVVNNKDMTSVQKIMQKLDIEKNRVKIKTPRVNTAEFSKRLCETIKTSLRDVKTTSIANMHTTAGKLGLAVDENKTVDQKKIAEKIIRRIGLQTIPEFKRQQLPLQGEHWKRLSELEKEECRISNFGSDVVEHQKAELREQKNHIWELQNKKKMSQGMQDFIATLSTSDKEERHVFLKWMKFQFNTHSRDQLTSLRKKLKEQCQKKNAKLIAVFNQALVDSSLGVEHYMREMGLNYEVSVHVDDSTGKICHLPAITAEMLLDGYPLELLDGDASNIPEKWVTAVLMELHKKVGGRSRLLVVAVLGVQSTGKSTLLNTMFGVQLAVSSGRCTRGAYMLFLKVGDDAQQELGCDFILLIDTEGLKSPDLAQIEDSYEHDNQLATFVIGLSDVAIINIAMENANEMKDVLQIAVHAFLRMKQIGKRTICHFVHQNVAEVSAHNKSLTERQHLLDKLNEMTKIAAEMERQPGIHAFTDVLDYDIQNNNWNIPGLWHGTPPMAPVNIGYSEAVSDFKKNLLEMVGKDKQFEASTIPKLLEWMRCLWKSLKYENFIFSFRNTLVAHAYDNLSKEFLQWEWEMKKEIFPRQTAAELEIVNTNNEVGLETWNSLITTKKTELAQEIETQQSKMNEKLCDYYGKRDGNIKLIEKYKTDFYNSIKGVSNEIRHSVNAKLDRALYLKIAKKKALDIQQEYRGRIEERVMKLLCDCKDTTLSDDQLREEFHKMWASATINVPALKDEDIPASILTQLKKNVSNRNVNEELQHIQDLLRFGTDSFKTRHDHVDPHNVTDEDMWTNFQMYTNDIIETEKQFVFDQTKSNGDYNDSFSRDLLQRIDKSLNKGYNLHRSNTRFEIDIKLHICGFAAREFLKMHQRFLLKIDPRTQLEKHKNQYLMDFMDLYKQTDHCQRKANNFVQFCIKPAIEDYMNRTLGIDIVNNILISCESIQFSSRSRFQYSIQKELLLKDDFRAFLKFICQYEMYVKEWIFVHILENLQDNTLCKLKLQILEVVVNKILRAFECALKKQSDGTESIPNLVHEMRLYLRKDITISEEAEKLILFQINCTMHSFTQKCIASLKSLKETLHVEFSNTEDIPETLNKLAVKPQDELFKRILGCGQQCPFCKISCEAGGKNHRKHHASVHRPQGLGKWRNQLTNKLGISLCTNNVQSTRSFMRPEKFVRYRDYNTVFSDWYIPPDPTMEASDYWKFVMVRYNDSFAKEYFAKPAQVPEAWKRITKEQALKGLKDTFNIF
ncbi:up-regulator of cell proliferation-like [Nerophis lumbriciformis]|uniref:up-regulator of cell proliferation-like n=1 Tax=Nerophis lumbriciformis TaxID=546530 RepID=UPI002ADF65E1|nr:up-regulator of cell proliferation-like [Nerophis lumbriciformis]